jgi:hypothetical protein
VGRGWLWGVGPRAGLPVYKMAVDTPRHHLHSMQGPQPRPPGLPVTKPPLLAADPCTTAKGAPGQGGPVSRARTSRGAGPPRRVVCVPRIVMHGPLLDRLQELGHVGRRGCHHTGHQRYNAQSRRGPWSQGDPRLGCARGWRSAASGPTAGHDGVTVGNRMYFPLCSTARPHPLPFPATLCVTRVDLRHVRAVECTSNTPLLHQRRRETLFLTHAHSTSSAPLGRLLMYTFVCRSAKKQEQTRATTRAA